MGQKQPKIGHEHENAELPAECQLIVIGPWWAHVENDNLHLLRAPLCYISLLSDRKCSE